MTRARLEIAPNVVEMASAQRVEAAWLEYQQKAVEVAAEPHLICDRDFNEELARRYDRWRRLFLMRDQRC